jgi:hypothetical protein
VARSNPGAHAQGSRTGRRVATAVAVLVVVAGGLYGASALEAHGDARKPKAAGAPSAQTTTVTRTDLSDTRTLPGTLGFGGAMAVKGAGTGLVTELPQVSATVARGKPLYWVNDQPVMVFFGDTPLFRTLDKPGMSGRDVTVLADNLLALGYDIGPVIEAARAPDAPQDSASGRATKLTPQLLAALKRWQRNTGQRTTGTLAVGQVVVVPGTARVSGVKAALGDPAAEDIATLTSEQKSVTVKADPGSADEVHDGDAVTITLPDARQIPGRVSSVGTTVQGGPSTDDPTGSETAPTLLLTVVPGSSADVKGLDAASVQVTFTTATERNVLVVPVGALLALQEGGYALQRPDGQLVAVKTGLFAKGRVEVSGAGIAAGDRVVTTS